MFKKYNYLIYIILVFLLTSPEIVSANGKKKTKVVVLSGKIESQVDFFGRRFFKGEVINKNDKRVDYVFIEFKLFDEHKKILAKVKSYVNGSVHVFRDSTVSTSSLEPGKSAKFSCYTSVKDDLIKSYNYNIRYKVFDELPDKY